MVTPFEKSWGSTQLHHGDTAAAASGTTAKHNMQFSVEGILRTAFDFGLDKRKPTKHMVDIRAAVASCALERQRQIADEIIANAGFLFIERSFDDTPLDCPFGLLSEYLTPVARYVVPYQYRDLLGKSYASYSEVLSVGIPPRMRHGVVDIFQESITVDAGAGKHFHLLAPPRVLLGKKAGHIFRALQSTLDSYLSVEALAALGKTVIILVLNGDSASSNRKAMLYFARSASSSTLVFSSRCIVHQLFRAVITVLERLELVRPMFALTNVLNLSSRQDTLRRAVCAVVTTNFDYELVEDDHALASDESSEHRQHTRLLVDQLFTERKVRMDFGGLTSSDSIEKHREVAKDLIEMLPGRWHSKRILHRCRGRSCKCGGTPEKARAYIVQLFFYVIFSVMPQSPSFNRWTVLGPHCAWLALVLLMHHVFKDAWFIAFGKEKLEA